VLYDSVISLPQGGADDDTQQTTHPAGPPSAADTVTLAALTALCSAAGHFQVVLLCRVTGETEKARVLDVLAATGVFRQGLRREVRCRAPFADPNLAGRL